MKKAIVLAFSLFLLLACSKNNGEPEPSAVTNIGLSLEILNSQGEDMLNPQTPGYIRPTKLYVWKKGQWGLYYEPHETLSNGIYVGLQEKGFEDVPSGIIGWD